MRRFVSFTLGSILLVAPAFAAEDVESAVVGTVKTVDKASKTIVIKTADGTEKTIHYVDKTAVHGGEVVKKDSEIAAKDTAKETKKGAQAGVRDLKEGSEVVVHYTTKGTKDTAREVDHIGKDGLRMTEGTIKKIDHEAKTVTVVTANGAEETYQMGEHAAKTAAKDAKAGTEKAGKVTMYYTEEAGHKIAHFFKN